MPESLQLEALNSLVPTCKQYQIRHLHNLIAPYFQIDFIRLLPKEVFFKFYLFLFVLFLSFHSKFLATCLLKIWCFLQVFHVHGVILPKITFFG